MTIQDLLTQLNIPFLEGGGHHHARSGWIQLDCPFCGTKGKYHMGYNPRAGYFACWRCGGHHPFKVLSRLGLENAEARAFCNDKEASPLESKRPRKGLKEPLGRGKLLRAHRSYLQGREFSPRKLKELWEIEGLGPIGPLAWRIYIPIIHNGQRVSWTARSIAEDAGQRYMSASAEEESINHKELVYGMDYCLHSILIVEGPTDVWKLGPGAGALFGTAFSEAQVAKLIKVPHRFIVFDNAPTAQRRARKLAEQLSTFPGETENIQIDAEDPGSATDREVRLLRKIAGLP